MANTRREKEKEYGRGLMEGTAFSCLCVVRSNEDELVVYYEAGIGGQKVTVSEAVCGDSLK